MTITSQQLRELAGKATQGAFIPAASDTHVGRLAIWADGGMAGATQIAILPPEFAEVKANADLIAILHNNLPAIITALELQETLDKPETVSLGADIIADNVSGPTLREVDWKALHRTDQENAVRKFIHALKGDSQ